LRLLLPPLSSSSPSLSSLSSANWTFRATRCLHAYSKGEIVMSSRSNSSIACIN
jgi:hypothetical protein